MDYLMQSPCSNFQNLTYRFDFGCKTVANYPE